MARAIDRLVMRKKTAKRIFKTARYALRDRSYDENGQRNDAARACSSEC